MFDETRPSGERTSLSTIADVHNMQIAVDAFIKSREQEPNKPVGYFKNIHELKMEWGRMFGELNNTFVRERGIPNFKVKDLPIETPLTPKAQEVFDITMKWLAELDTSFQKGQ